MPKRTVYKMPPLVPRMRALKHALTSVNNPTPFLNRNIAEFGKTYTFHMAGVKKGILTTEPQVIQHILQKNNRNYRKSNMQSVILGHYIGRGLLTSEGEFWLRQRRLIQPAFHRSKLDGLVSIVQDELESFFNAEWSTASDRQIYPDMHKLAFRIVARALFSTALSESEIRTLSNQISEVQKFIVRRIRQPYLHYWFRFAGHMRKYDAINEKIQKTILGVIQKRKKNPTDSDDLLNLLLSTRYEDTGEPMEDRQILDESMIMFTAGHETTAIALAWTLFLLAANPKFIDIIRKEADRRDGNTLAEVMKMQQTKQVIEESMRLYPPGWILDRLSNDDDSVAGWTYPKDTFFIMWIYGMHRDPDLWPNPEVFDPSRFDPARKKEQVPYSYVPFGGGPRLCIGNQFAMMEMIQVVSYVAGNYDIAFRDSDIGTRPMLTLRPASPMTARVSKRAEVAAF